MYRTDNNGRSDKNNGRINSDPTKREEHLSPDGLWRSYPKVPNLLSYVKSGVFYRQNQSQWQDNSPLARNDRFYDGQIKAGGLYQRTSDTQVNCGDFGQARADYERELDADHSISENSKRYRRYCVSRLIESWPDLDELSLEKVTEPACKACAAKLAQEVDETYFNNILGTLRSILKRGGLVDNPAGAIKRLGIKKTEMKLPEPEQFLQRLCRSA